MCLDSILSVDVAQGHHFDRNDGLSSLGSENNYHYYSFIHSVYFYSAPSSPLLIRSTPDTSRILCGSFTPKRHRQLWVKNFPNISVA